MKYSPYFEKTKPILYGVFLFLICSAFIPFASAVVLIGGNGIVPNPGSIPAADTVLLDPSIPLVVQNCNNITISGIEHNASNYAQALPGYNVTANLTSTYNVTNTSTSTGFTMNLTAPCTTSPTFALQNLTVFDNSSNSNNKTLVFYVSNATNVSVVFLNQKPPFALNANSTVNITYYNGSNPLSGDIPVVAIFNSSNQLENSNINVYNFTPTTDSSGTMQYNISVGPNAASTYSFVVDYGYNVFPFEVQSAYGLSFLTQDVNGSTTSFFAPNVPINLIAKSKYGNGTTYVLSGGDSITALVTLPNSTVYSYPLSALDSVNSPGANNFTVGSLSLNGPYNVHVIAKIQGNVYETFGQFNIQAESVTVSSHSDFIKQDGQYNALLPGSVVTFDVAMTNLTSGNLMTGLKNGEVPGTVNCSSVSLNSFTDAGNNSNVSWGGSATSANSSYPIIGSICTMTVGVPSYSGDFRLNVSVNDPASPGNVLNAYGVISVRNYGLRFNSCPVTSDFTPCGYDPFFLVGKNATFQMTIDNFSSGASLGTAAFLNVTRIAVRSINFSGGSSNENTSWVVNASYFISYPQSDPNSERLLLTLPSNMQDGPTEVSVTVNTTVGLLKARSFFIVKKTSVNGFAFPFSANGNGGPQINCSGTNPFMLNAVDLNTKQPLHGVKMEGILSGQTMSGISLDATYLTGSTTNTTDESGMATFNITIDGTKKINGFVMMTLNISYQGTYDTAIGGFLCGSANYDLVPGSGNGGSFGGGNGGGPNQGPNGIVGNPVTPMGGWIPVTNPNNPIFIGFNNLDFVGDMQNQNNNGPSGINGTLKFLSVRFNDPNSGRQTIYPANGAVLANVSNGNLVDPNGFFSINLFPTNFSLTSWPLGMAEFSVNLTNGTKPGDHQGPSALGRLPGFQSVLFKVIDNATNNYGPGQFPNGPTVFWSGSNMSVLLNVSSNVSLSGNNITVKFRSGSGFQLVPAQIISSVEQYHAWNNPFDDCCKANGWNVTFVVPTLESGPVQEIFTVNNSQGITQDFTEYGEVASLVVQPLKRYTVWMSAACSAIYDAAGQNGSLQGCGALQVQDLPMPFFPGPYSPPANFASRLNMSIINNTYHVASKGRQVCFKEALNATDPFHPELGVQSLDNVTDMAIFDNATPNVYDTIVVNTTDGNLTVYSMSNLTGQHREFYRFNQTYAALYVVGPRANSCVAMVASNVSAVDQNQAQSGFDLGSMAVNMPLDVMYRVINNNAGINGSVVDLTGLANGTQTAAGFNFINMMPSTSYVVRNGVADKYGVVPLELNITTPGDYMAMWKANATVGSNLLTAFAKIGDDYTQNGGGDSGNTLRAYSFKSSCGPANGFFQVSSPNQNLTVNCNANYFNGTGFSNVNFTVSQQVFSNFGPSLQPMVVSNLTTGVIYTGLLTNGAGFVNFNFTQPGGWQNGRYYELVATASFNGQVQNIDLHGVAPGSGMPGSFNGH